ncbi:MAG TPA: ABC transporter permease [Synergistetes bacterium]|nr:ABC transporter permease [Synergistota bacterium]
MNLVSWVGKQTVDLFSTLGEFALFGYRVVIGTFAGRWSRDDLLEQLERVGVSSVLVVSITSAFTGMVMAVQTLDQFVRFGATGYIGGVIALSLIREMSPVLTGLVVSGRVGAAMAAEIGSMKVTEQVDAMRTFGLDPNVFVGVPRVLAGLIMLPVLTLFSFVIGIGGGFAYVMAHGVNPHLFKRSVEALLNPSDIYGGVLKAAVFGLLITISACGQGFMAGQGARGVGSATTRAVVWGNMLILIFNYILSTLLFGGIKG